MLVQVLVLVLGRRALSTLMVQVVLAGWAVCTLFCGPAMAEAAPGLCVGPVCADEITRSAKHHWQLRLRLNDQQGRHERLVVDCRDGRLSPESGSVERGYASAVARRACRLAST